MSMFSKNAKINRAVVRIFQGLMFWPTYFLLRLFVSYEVRGRQNLIGLEKGPIIFASNHCSLIDGPICAALMPRYKGEWYPKSFFPIRFLVVSRFFKWRYGLVALYVRLNGSIKIFRHTGKDLSIILREAISCLNRGGHIWIYPEGKLTKNGQLRRGRRGITYLHQQTGAIIVPVAIKGVFGILSWKTLLGRRKVMINIGNPIHSLGNVSLYEGSDRVMSEVKRLLQMPTFHSSLSVREAIECQLLPKS